jgi:hypothetical protein
MHGSNADSHYYHASKEKTQTIEQHAFVQGLKHVLYITYISRESSPEDFVELFHPRRLSALNVSSSLYYMFSFVITWFCEHNSRIAGGPSLILKPYPTLSIQVTLL